MLKINHFIMLMVVVHILLNIFYSAFQIESITINNTTVKYIVSYMFNSAHKFGVKKMSY